MRQGEVWFATTPGGNGPVLVLTRDPVADCVVNFDSLHTLPRSSFRRMVVRLDEPRMAEACQRLRDSTDC